MSYDSQRGYLIGILQRGARLVGRPNSGRRLLSGQGALEHSSAVNPASASAGVDWLKESSAAAELNTITQNPIQTKQVAHPQIGPSETHSPNPAADTSPERPTATGARSTGFSKAATQTRDLSFDQVKLTPADAPSESSAAAELNTITQSPIQTKQVAHPPIGPSETHSPNPAADTSPERPTAAGARSTGFSKAATQTRDSSFDQVKLTPADAPSESFQTKQVVHPQIQQSGKHPPNPAPDAPEKPTAAGARSTGFSKAATQTRDSSFDQLKLTPADAPSESFQTKQVVHPKIQQSETHSPNPAADTLERPTAAGARSTGLSKAATRTRDSSFDQVKLTSNLAADTPEKPTAAGAQSTGFSKAATRTRDSSFDQAPADNRFSEPRLPRLVVIEQGGKTISSDNSSPDTREAIRRVIVEENADTFEPQRFTDLRTDERGPRSTQLLSSQSSTIRSAAPLDLTPGQDNRNVNREMSPSRHVQLEYQAATSLQADISESSRRSPRSALPNGSPQQESTQSVLANAPEVPRESPAGRFRVQPSDSNAERTKVTLAPARAERMEESFVWRGSLPAQAEEQYSRRLSGPQQPRAAPTPKLTINRLDVQIVNQSSAPTAPVQTAQAPEPTARPFDGWENLERHQLGHLHLIF